MQALILAAGYATRLYPLTENTPKPLLKVGNKTIIEYILVELEKVPGLNQVYIVTNDKFYPDFVNWSKNIKTSCKLKILNDGTLSNEDRLGAIGDIHFTVQQEKINDDLLVIAGDNLFGFSLSHFLDFFKNKNASVVAFHDLKDPQKLKGKYGVGILQGSKIIDFEEKPLQPKSSLASTACYLFKKGDLPRTKILVAMGKADAPGNLIKYLAQDSEVHAFIFEEHWFDVGTFESLEEAKKVYK
ncbi:nucleotidyltransferase family protein [Candidatus Woesearchaeota archaeon]|nr:nucleotidyltransferase family protein [Candidatus Woesearchaeota archaeon]